MGENNIDTTPPCATENPTNGYYGQQKRNINEVQQGSIKNEPEKPRKRFKKVKSPDNIPKNPISILNEMYKGLKYCFVLQKGPTNDPIFTVQVEVAGTKYEGYGRSKALAKYSVAKKILEIIDPSRICQDEPTLEMGTLFGSFSSDSSLISDGENEKVMEKNPISILNELRSGLKYLVMETHGPSHAPLFKVGVEIDGQMFYGIGRSKKMAKCAAASEALKSFIQLPNNKQIKSAPEYANLDFSIDQFETKKKQQQSSVVKKNVVKGPVVQLNEAYPNAEYKCIDTEGELQSRYKVTVEINGRSFEGTGASKKLAKRAAASTALYTLLSISNTSIAPGIIRANVSSQEQAKADLIGKMVNEKFTMLMADDLVHAKRKVLAGIVQMTGDDHSSAKVIAVSTGTKCISGSYMSMTGKVLNDLHAEIVARRCLMRYLFDQLSYAMHPENTSIFVRNNDSNSFKLRDGIDFHLYINTAPCGDARIFSPHDDNEGSDKHPNRNSRGQLRTKIESGEGTIPVKPYSVIQTWDGVLQGERLRTMSCSDKICKWNVLGVQGALLSNIIEPIYLKSIVLGSLLKESHLKRAICGRIEQTLQGLPPPFLLNRPPAYLTTSTEVRHPTKAPSFSINWMLGDDCVEIINTENGRTENGDKSKLCKNEFLKKYRNLTEKLASNNINQCKYTSTLYCDIKNANPNYQIAKRALYEAFQKAGIGMWVSKPIEQDMFQIDDDNNDDENQKDNISDSLF